ncbi:MAG TPA: phage tail protein, partial [Stellaceae bacterium]|nr:phage tail protein [Stellaceae bacterium]
YYDVTANGASEAIAVPFAAPSTYVCQNPKGVPFTQSGIVALESTYAFGSSSSGIYYTDTDPPSFLTHVSGTPSAGEYSFSNYTITFAAADAGKAVTVVDLAVSPGVFYGSIVTGDLVAGSRNVGSLSGITGLPPGAAVSGSGVAPGTVIAGLSGGTGTGAVSAGSATVTLSGGTFVAAPGTGIIDSDALFPPGTSVSSYSGPYFATLSASAAGTGWETLVFTTMPTAASDAVYPGAGTVGSITLSSGTGVLVGAIMSIDVWSYPVNDIATVATVAGDVISFQLTDAALGAGYPPLIIGQPISFATSSTGHLSAGSDVINGLTFAPATGASVTDPLGYLPADGSATVSGAAPSSLVLSADATGSSAADVITFLSELVLSLPATATVPGTSLTVTGAALQQVAGSAPTSSGQFTLTPQGLYTFSSADAGKTVVIVDVPDANPADVVADFLTNPTYGVPLFAPARLGDLSIFRAWCQASGLFVSPVLTSQQQATQLLQDLMTATNSAAVWSGGKLTVVPYGDAALTGNGASYTPPAAPLYSLDDDDFLANEATNSASVSASSSPDPVTVTRLDPADQVNDVQVEYLDRAQDYNPVIAEAQDDALINLYGLKPSGSKQLHCLCERKAAMLSAQLQLGRQQIRNLYSFTVGREFILLDPMDIVAITDAGIGARNQWVRIREITENMDRSLSIVAEDYLAGTGAAPRYGHQAGAGYRPNFNADPGAALAPVFMDVPAELVQALGCEGWLATNGGALWGGCEVWQSSDDANYSYAGTLQGGSVMGTLTASFGSGSDPDTTDTCAVDLTESRGALLPGTAADADAGNTVCFVCDPDGSNGEYFSYEQAVLTSQYHYDLGKHGASAGYLRRGLYGSAIAAHAAGSLFVRLKPNAVFKLPFAKGQIGNTIHVKLLSFNIWGGGRQTLDQATSYAHTIGGNAPALSSVGALGLYTDL